MINAVIFDMDGVLFDTERLSRTAWIRIAQKMGIDGIEDTLLCCIGLNRNDAYTVFADRYGVHFPAKVFLDAARDELNQMIETDGLPLKPGVRPILSYLEQKRIPTAVCSSTRVKSIQSHLERTGLTAYFQEVIGGDMVEHSKPEPDIYQKACSALRCNPEDCMAIEDSPNGIRSASRAGLQTVMIPDLVAPTPELLSLCQRKEDSLIGLLVHLQEVWDGRINQPV